MSVDGNKELIRSLIDEVFNEGRPERLAQYWDPATRHEADAAHETLATAFPDLRVEIDDLVAEGDKVVARLTFRGTHGGPFHGIPGTGRAISFGAIRIYRLSDGRVVETWAHQDAMGLVAQVRG